MDAVYYMASSVFGFGVRYIECSLCGYPHLDKDWFSVHPHRRHLCAGCGRHFRDTAAGIGNPIAHLQTATGLASRHPVPAGRSLSLSQEKYPGGIQIWGSNPAIIWSAEKSEEEGIHVHAFKGDDDTPDLDDTFSKVTINGVTLDPMMVRTLMAQNALPHIAGRVFSMKCVDCNRPAFDTDEAAFTPKVGRRCSKCGGSLTGAGRLRKAIANPIIGVLERLSFKAPRSPQRHFLGFLPETL
jgi:NAD-dependent SIR2 family protein deacetylase